MAQFQKQRKRFRNKHRGGPPGPAQRTGLLPHTLKTVEQVWIDYEKLPRDLSEQELAEIFEEVDKPRRGKAKEADVGDYSELLKLSLADLHDTAEAEGLDNLDGKRREEVIWELTKTRLTKRIPLRASGTLDIKD